MLSVMETSMPSTMIFRQLVCSTVVCLLLALLAGGCTKQTPDDREPTESTTDQSASESGDATRASEDSSTDGGQKRAEAPGGGFTVPVPPNWTAEPVDERLTVTSPNGGVAVEILSMQTKDLRTAVERGWKRLDLDRTLEVRNEQTPPAREGFDETLVVNYKVAGGEHFNQAVVHRRGETAYVILLHGGIAAVQKRASQMKIVTSGLEVADLEKTDISDHQAAPLEKSEMSTLDDFVQAQRKQFEIPGLSVAVVQDGEVVFSKGYGVRKLDGEAEVTPETLMMIGSVTKSMTTTLMAKAVDEDKYDWETPAREVLPRFEVSDPELTDKITMKHLVCACTGVPRRDFEMLFRSDELGAEQTIESLASFETFTNFGEAFQYSNQMVATGGYITAAAYGGKWGELQKAYRSSMHANVFGPIGMDRTKIAMDEALALDNHAHPHNATIDGEFQAADIDIERFATPVAPAGAVWSTADDMARYLVTHLQKGEAPSGERVVSAENLTRTWQPQIQVSDDTHYGLGWMRKDYKGKDLVTHGGATLGFNSQVGFIPADDLGVVVLANSNGASPAAGAIRDRVFELAYDLPAKSQKEAAFASKEVDKHFERMRQKLADEPMADSAEQFAGTYRNEDLGQLELRIEEGAFVADIGELTWTLHRLEPDAHQAPEAVDVYMGLEPPRLLRGLELRRNDEGQRFLRLGMGARQYDFQPVD
jgi:CubicO group peptidase (beta-lactamase class C family)